MAAKTNDFFRHLGFNTENFVKSYLQPNGRPSNVATKLKHRTKTKRQNVYFVS